MAMMVVLRKSPVRDWFIASFWRLMNYPGIQKYFRFGNILEMKPWGAITVWQICKSNLHFPEEQITFVSLFEGVLYFNTYKMDPNSYKTSYANKATVEKSWVVVDANSQVLGRVASQVAHILRGKHKTSYSPHVDCGDHVIVINAEKVRMTGKKWTDRVIFTHSAYPGGQREHTPTLIRSKHPERLIEHAVRGMLPKKQIGKRALQKSARLYRRRTPSHSTTT